VLAIAGGARWCWRRAAAIGEEVDDRELLDLELEVLDVVVTNKELVAGRRSQRAGAGATCESSARRVPAQDPPHRRGDAGHVPGPQARARRHRSRWSGARAGCGARRRCIGYADRVTEETDMVVMGIGIVIGALIGALTFELGGVPLTLSAPAAAR
jgi:putative transport protein